MAADPMGQIDSLDRLSQMEARKAMMRSSNWIAAAEGGSREYIPISSTPLDNAYQRSKSATRAEYLGRLESQTRAGAENREKFAPADSFIAAKYNTTRHSASAGDQAGESIVLGSDPMIREPSNSAYGLASAVPVEKIDLLQSVPKLRDSTLDGSHRASMNETHFLSIWEPYDSNHPDRSASFRSAVQLREAHHRHIRSQYHPDEKYFLPPTVQNDMGWNLNLEKYKESCAKFQEGASWHGRKGMLTAHGAIDAARRPARPRTCPTCPMTICHERTRAHTSVGRHVP